VLTELIARYDEMMGRTLYPADPIRLFINWVASVIIQQRVIINEAARQNVPRYAEGEYLDNLSELFFGVERIEGLAATVNMRFEISKAQEEEVVIEAGTRVKANDDIVFATDEALTITEGSTFAEVTATAVEVGTAYNGFEAGQINKIVDPYPYCSKVSNTTVSGGGVDIEDDDSFYNRMRESLEGKSTAGAIGGYKYYAESADARIADVAVSSPSAGNVLIKVLCTDGELPGEDVISKVYKAVNADDVRPLTDNVTVSAADTYDYSIDMTYYISSPNADSVNVVKEAVDKAVESYIKWQSGKMGRDINPSYLINLVMEAGAKRVMVNEPTYHKLPVGTVAVLNDKAVTYGGIEDE
jgi:phage-related baseplate assembly protein